jgi:hypothetical protein
MRVVVEEIYTPIVKSGLLRRRHLDGVFLNLEQLMDENDAFLQKLQGAKKAALEAGDTDLLSVNIGQLFLEATTMFPAFHGYCTRQVSGWKLM